MLGPVIVSVVTVGAGRQRFRHGRPRGGPTSGSSPHGCACQSPGVVSSSGEGKLLRRYMRGLCGGAMWLSSEVSASRRRTVSMVSPDARAIMANVIPRLRARRMASRVATRACASSRRHRLTSSRGWYGRGMAGTLPSQGPRSGRTDVDLVTGSRIDGASTWGVADAPRTRAVAELARAGLERAWTNRWGDRPRLPAFDVRGRSDGSSVHVRTSCRLCSLAIRDRPGAGGGPPRPHDGLYGVGTS